MGSGPGVQGTASGGQGVYGKSSVGEGIYAYNTFTDIYAYLADTVWAGYFSGDVHINGSLGIGTSTPSYIVDIQDETNKLLRLQTTHPNSHVDIFATPSGGGGLQIWASGGNGHIAFFPGAPEKVRFTQDGNVGIGTTTPISNLEVEDTNPEMRLDAAVGGGAYLRFSQDDDQKAFIRTNANGDLQLDTEASGAEAITILNSNANVGIGVTTPARTLHVGDAMRLEPTTAPSSPSEGDMYMDSTTHKLMVYDGTTWQACW
jgi:hypothetical protein